LPGVLSEIFAVFSEQMIAWSIALLDRLAKIRPGASGIRVS
jgi:hypothetical protein